MLALAQLARIARSVLWAAPCDTSTLLSALNVSLTGGHRELARQLALAATPAWVAQVATRGLEAIDTAPREAMDEQRAALVGSDIDRVRALAALGRIAGPMAFLAIVLELASAFAPGHGLLALQRGLVQSLALERAALSFSIGLATALVCALSGRLLRERLQALSHELKRTRETLLRTLESTADM